jgi:penicillin-binding protein-related factor A (putative recombinase)
MKAKKFGELFEGMFQANCTRLSVIATRFPDGCKTLGANRVIRVATPFDWILTYQGTSAFIDTKATAGGTFPYSKIVEHQIVDMNRHATQGAQAGYCVWLRSKDVVIFIPVALLLKAHDARLDGSFDTESPGVKLLGFSFSWDVRLIFAKPNC